jgi:hypothetical protein
MSASTVLDTKDSEIAKKNAQITPTVDGGDCAVLISGRAEEG